MFERIRQDDKSAVYREVATGAKFTAEKQGGSLTFPPGTPMELLMLVIREETEDSEA